MTILDYDSVNDSKRLYLAWLDYKVLDHLTRFALSISWFAPSILYWLDLIRLDYKDLIKSLMQHKMSPEIA